MARAPHAGVLCLLLVAAGCGDGDGGGGVIGGNTAQVVLAYDAPTAVDPAVEAAFPDCFAAVGSAHVHPSWRGFGTVAMVAVGATRWEVTLSDVPCCVELVIGVNDPNRCSAANGIGSVSSDFSANGVTLSRMGSGPGGTDHDGTGFMFMADEDGDIFP